MEGVEVPHGPPHKRLTPQGSWGASGDPLVAGARRYVVSMRTRLVGVV